MCVYSTGGMGMDIAIYIIYIYWIIRVWVYIYRHICAYVYRCRCVCAPGGETSAWLRSFVVSSPAAPPSQDNLSQSVPRFGHSFLCAVGAWKGRHSAWHIIMVRGGWLPHSVPMCVAVCASLCRSLPQPPPPYMNLSPKHQIKKCTSARVHGYMAVGSSGHLC